MQGQIIIGFFVLEASPKLLFYLQIMILPRKAVNNEYVPRMRLWKNAYVSGIVGKKTIIFR